MTDFEKAIQDAIVAKFFEPIGSTIAVQVVDPNTGQSRIEYQNQFYDPPVTNIARILYRNHENEILEGVKARLDLDDIIEKCVVEISNRVVTKLTEAPYSWAAKPNASEKEKMLSKVYDRVAEEFGRQCVEHLKNTGGLMNILEGG